jgi:hypothetical protein
MIDFTVHKQALSQMSARHQQLVKQCHDIIPTAKITHRFNPFHSAFCVLCKSEVKDLNHLLRCQHPDRKPWQHRMFAFIRTTCDCLNTRPYLIDMILEGLATRFNSSTVDKTAFSTQFHRLIHEQNLLEWRQLFQGRMSNELAHL